MTAIALALLAAALYGIADFLGGFASRKASSISVAAVSQLTGLVALVVAAPLFSSRPTGADLAWGGAAGLGGGLGLALLYHALAKGKMSLAAPMTTVCAISVPVLVGLALGERPSRWALAGVAVAAASVALLGAGSSRGAPRAATDSGSGFPRHRGALLSVAAGAAIGIFYVCLQRTGPAAGLWPLLAARSSSVAAVSLAGLSVSRRLAVPASSLYLILSCGAFDVVANVLYLLAVRQGSLVIVATLTSLYPASTILLARLILGERLSAGQGVGIGLATLSVVLISAG